MQYLYDEYGKMTPEQIMDKEEEIKHFVLDHIQLISTVFNVITIHTDLCELPGEIITDSSMVKIGYIVMNIARVFKDSLVQWNDKSTVDKTWKTFQIHF